MDSRYVYLKHLYKRETNLETVIHVLDAALSETEIREVYLVEDHSLKQEKLPSVSFKLPPSAFHSSILSSPSQVPGAQININDKNHNLK